MSLRQSTVFCVFAAFLVSFQSIKGHPFDRCSIGHQEKDGMWFGINSSELFQNFPKVNEILRTKAFLKGTSPAFKVINNGNEVIFGNSMNLSYFCKM